MLRKKGVEKEEENSVFKKINFGFRQKRLGTIKPYGLKDHEEIDQTNHSTR